MSPPLALLCLPLDPGLSRESVAPGMKSVYILYMTSCFLNTNTLEHQHHSRPLILVTVLVVLLMQLALSSQWWKAS